MKALSQSVWWFSIVSHACQRTTLGSWSNWHRATFDDSNFPRRARKLSDLQSYSMIKYGSPRMSWTALRMEERQEQNSLFPPHELCFATVAIFASAHAAISRRSWLLNRICSQQKVFLRQCTRSTLPESAMACHKRFPDTWKPVGFGRFQPTSNGSWQIITSDRLQYCID